MKQQVIFDHCVPKPLQYSFSPTLEITNARQKGWERVKNGNLEKLAAQDGFAALITVDTDFADSRKFPSYELPVFLLRAYPKVVFEALLPLIPSVEALLGESPDIGLYIFDNYKGTVLTARSLSENIQKRAIARSVLGHEGEKEISG